MELQFLGTGPAWCIPEHTCPCAVCSKMRQLGEERTRSCFTVTTQEHILVDCGPDIRSQMIACGTRKPDLVLITHEHGDHFLGLDDLLCFRRAVPAEEWNPIPVYATEETWKQMELRFGYLLGSLLEKRIAVPEEELSGIQTKIIPFKTFHGPTASGSVGYILEENKPKNLKLVYTSDFMSVPNELEALFEPDVLIIQAHWLHEPAFNRPNHMSLQNAIPYINKWKPKNTYLIHISDGDSVSGDPHNNILKKSEAKNPLTPPGSSVPYEVPKCRTEWEQTLQQVAADYNLPGNLYVSQDGLRLSI